MPTDHQPRRPSLLQVGRLPGPLETGWVRLIYADEKLINGEDRFDKCQP